MRSDITSTKGLRHTSTYSKGKPQRGRQHTNSLLLTWHAHGPHTHCGPAVGWQGIQGPQTGVWPSHPRENRQGPHIRCRAVPQARGYNTDLGLQVGMPPLFTKAWQRQRCKTSIFAETKFQTSKTLVSFPEQYCHRACQKHALYKPKTASFFRIQRRGNMLRCSSYSENKWHIKTAGPSLRGSKIAGSNRDSCIIISHVFIVNRSV